MRRTDDWGRAVRRAALVAAVTGVLAAVVAGAPAVAATGDTDTDTSITVAWAGGNDPAVQQYQPDHTLLSDGEGGDGGSGHWDDFKDLTLTVSKTSGLVDEVVTVTAQGMSPTRIRNGSNGQEAKSNYLQLMQCWGDPTAVDFAKNCQWGAWSADTGDLTSSKAAGAVLSYDATSRGIFAAHGAIPFRAVTGAESKPQHFSLPGSGSIDIDGTSDFFSASSSNEQFYVPVTADGSARTAFQVQSALTQPYLGCGDPKRGAERCWLVAVPRGIHSGELAPDDTGTLACIDFGKPWGQETYAQVGSPVSPDCSYWNDRIVVPLDFRDVSGGCGAASGSIQFQGTELFAPAMRSWQSELCTGGGSTYTMSSGNSPDLMRAQLLSGQSPLVVVNRPLTADDIGTTPAAVLEGASMSYAPLANTGLVIGYVASTTDAEYRDLRLTPRLLAKLMTQSYRDDLPYLDGGFKENQPAYRPGRPIGIMDDPEWAALGNPSPRTFGPAATLSPFVIVGPQGDDAFRLLWQYVQSDADAAAFLRGEPDPWGLTVNPSYLPAGSAGVNGAGVDVDLSQVPRDALTPLDPTTVTDPTGAGKTIDSVGFKPNSGTFAENAARVFRADPRITNIYDEKAYISPNEQGKWVKQPAMAPGVFQGRFTLGPVTAADAERYQLGQMKLATPLSTRTGKDDVASARSFVAPSDESMTAAVQAMTTDPDTGTASLDLAALPQDAYPLTLTLYGAVNTTAGGLDSTTRERIAHVFDYAVADGNVRGAEAGALPDGYVPLTEAQKTQTRAAAETVRYEPPVSTPVGTAAAAPASQTGQGVAAPAALTTLPPSATTQTATVAAEAAPTAAPASSPAQVALGGSLLAGVAGVAVAPFLLRRRGLS